MKEVYVEYFDHIAKVRNSEVLTWKAFCSLSMESQMEILFCCFTDDPRVNQE